jgi:hypothetical protein
MHEIKARNNITIKDYSQMPDLVFILRKVARISKSSEISIVDMSNSYHQVRVNLKDKYLNTINTTRDILNIKVMLQGNCNIPTIITRIIINLLNKHIGK